MRTDLIVAGATVDEVDGMSLGDLALAWWQLQHQRERVARWIG